MGTSVRFQVRGDTAENWETKNLVLAQREIAYDMTNNRFKVGDGITQWNSLPYVKPDVIDALNSTSKVDSLSANMGRELNANKANVTDLTSLETRLTQIINQKADITALTNLEINLTQIINNGKVIVENVLTSTSTTNALSANQGRVLKGLVAQKADTTTVTNLETNLTQLINNSKVEIVDSLDGSTASRTKALSAYQGYVLNYWKLDQRNFNWEYWTFTLEDGSTVKKTLISLKSE